MQLSLINAHGGMQHLATLKGRLGWSRTTFRAPIGSFTHDIDGTLSRLVGSHIEASKFDAKIAANHLKLSLLVFLISFIIPRTLNPKTKF